MSAIDILIITVAVVSVVYGLRRGLIVQLGQVGGVICGIVACRLFGSKVAGMLAGNEASANELYVSGIAANIIVFVAAFILAWFAARLIKNVTHAIHLSAIDRVGGAVFTLFEWMLVLSLLFNVWQAIRPGTNVVEGSKLLDGKVAAGVIDFAPKVLDSPQAHKLFEDIDNAGRSDK